MRIVAKRALREFWERHPDAKKPLDDWHSQVRRADWHSPAQIALTWPRSSIIGNNRAVFRIKGNDYRLVAEMYYPGRMVYICFIGTHAEYNRINAEEIRQW